LITVSTRPTYLTLWSVLLASVSVVTLRIKYVATVEFVCVLRKYVRILWMRQVVFWAGSDLEYKCLKIITDCLHRWS
jgi:hypothetical protein